MPYTITKEDKYYINQYLNVDISSFSETIDEAINNLKEALKLYYNDNKDYKKSSMR